MAEERTEQATPKRREDARRRAETPRSPEVAGTAALLGVLLGLRMGWPAAVEQAARTVRLFVGECATWRPTVEATAEASRWAMEAAARIALPLALGAGGAALAANLGQTGFLVSAHPLALKWSRLSIGQGVVRMFSRQAMVAAGRSVAKLALVGAVGYTFLRRRCDDVLALGHGSALDAAGGLGALMWGLLVRVAGVFCLIAAADYLWQRQEHEKRLRMTRHEQREEHKHTEGDPLVRSRIRDRQRASARQRMIDAVKTATVVVTNPLEFAVALRYDPAKAPAPVVVAKGRRLMADRIRAEAGRHGVPVTPSPELARALYRSAPVGRQIPPDLYQAVAEILAFVYRLTGGQAR